MHKLLKTIGLFLISFLTASLYAATIGLLSRQLEAPFYAWPILMALLWFIFWKFDVLRFIGFIWSLPGALIGFELLWSVLHPGVLADKYVALDRSHYIPGQVKNPGTVETEPDRFGWAMKEVLFAPDGFRADPVTGKGNPDRCQFALIGDSMVYGSGLPYEYTLGPVLAAQGMRACVFGVTGNDPGDYLATLKYVAKRIDPGALVLFYLYAYNDFVVPKKTFRGLVWVSNRFPAVLELTSLFNKWRQSTFTFSLLSGRRASRCLDCGRTHRTSGKLWQYDVGRGVPIRVLYPYDPAEYRQPKPLGDQQRAALQLFFNRIAETARGRLWRVGIVIHPDDSEFYANLARHASAFVDLDPRRAEALKIRKEYPFFCTDISHYIYQRALEDGKNPYFINNRHFSIAGTRIVAESFVAQAKEISQSDQERVNAAAREEFP